jgi:hypothetical protein
LFSFSEICRLNEQELTYMKDVSLYEVVPTKFISLFLELYFIFYEFSKFLNELVQLKVAKLADSFLLPFLKLYGHGHAGSTSTERKMKREWGLIRKNGQPERKMKREWGLIRRNGQPRELGWARLRC